MNDPLTAVIVGAGHRSMLYASYAIQHPDELRIVGVADPDPFRRSIAAVAHDLPPERCYASAEALADAGRLADLAINGTMDPLHVPTSLPLLRAGYHLLLEKPFATGEEEMWELVRTARAEGRTVGICHVLRFAPFYAAIRQRVAEDAIGEILNMQTNEHVSYHHMAVAFVRGKWARRDRGGSSMLMAKCCHDLDLLVWMKSGVPPRTVSSLGGLSYFRPERAPEGAGTRCLVDCPIEPDCDYSAAKHYLDHPQRWAFYVWQPIEHLTNPTMEDRRASLMGDSLYGRCVWRCDNDVVDHQSVVVQFANGATATHNMVGGASRGSRSIHLIGTRGEIHGVFEESRFVVRRIDPRPSHEFAEEVVDLRLGGDMHGAFGGHGGGDLRLVGDFLRVVRGEPPSLSTTGLEDSIYGHLLGFRADRAMETGRVETLPPVE